MLLESKNLTKKYFNKTAVDNIEINLEVGKIYAILGPNGSGKTTFMKMVAGLVKPTSGSILVGGNSIGVETKKEVAYMSTEPFFYDFMDVEKVGKYYQDFFNDFNFKRYEELVQRMDLGMKEKSKTLSSGNAAKLKLAATLARESKLFMLDEPLNGIDVIARDKIMSTMIENAKEDTTLLISSHLVDELEKIVDSVIFMKQGKVVMQGDAEELRVEKQKSIVDIYKEIYA